MEIATKKEVKLVPELRFKEFEGEIKNSRFGDVIESNIYGPRFNSNDYSDFGNVKTIRGTDLSGDGEIKYEQVPLALLDEKTVSTHKLIDGDIVMITTADCGATGVFRKQNIDYLSSAYGVRIRLNNLGDSYFFKYFFQTWKAKKEINSYIRKATVANLPSSDILKIKLNIPSLPEQQKIATFLSAVDEKINQLTQKANLLTQYKKGVMQQLFSGKLRFKDENGKDFPEWEEKKLGEVATFLKGKGVSKSDLSDDGALECIRYGELYTVYAETITDIVSRTNALEKDLVLSHKNDVIIPASGETQIDIATASCVRKSNVALGGDLNIIRSENNGTFLAYYLNSALKFDIARLSQGISVVHLYSSQLKILNINIPEIEEQEKIATYLIALDEKLEQVNTQIEKAKTFKKGLLQQMFV